MKYTVLLITSALAILSLPACKDAGQNASSGNASLNDALDRVDARAPQSSAAGANTCLLNYADAMDGLLTPGLAAEAAGMDVTTAQTNYSKTLKNTAYHELSYSWANGRVATLPSINNSTITAPVKDHISLTGIKAISAQDFDRNYRPPTADQQAIADQTLDDAFSGKSTDPDAAKANENLRRQGVDQKTAKKVAGSMSSVFRQAAEAYVKVDGVGDDARWNTFEDKLYVLSGGVQFVLSADISADDNKNKAAAMALAQKLLQKCR